MTEIPVPTMGAILFDEFMTPCQLSMGQLARAIDVPFHVIVQLRFDQMAITPELSMKLGLYFGVSLMYFYNLQQDIKQRRKHAVPN